MASVRAHAWPADLGEQRMVLCAKLVWGDMLEPVVAHDPKCGTLE